MFNPLIIGWSSAGRLQRRCKHFPVHFLLNLNVFYYEFSKNFKGIFHKTFSNIVSKICFKISKEKIQKWSPWSTIRITQPISARFPFHIETSHLIWQPNQMTGFHMKCNTWLKWVKLLKLWDEKLNHRMKLNSSIWFLRNCQCFWNKHSLEWSNS